MLGGRRSLDLVLLLQRVDLLLHALDMQFHLLFALDVPAALCLQLLQCQIILLVSHGKAFGDFTGHEIRLGHFDHDSCLRVRRALHLVQTSLQSFLRRAHGVFKQARVVFVFVILTDVPALLVLVGAYLLKRTLFDVGCLTLLVLLCISIGALGTPEHDLFIHVLALLVARRTTAADNHSTLASFSNLLD